MFGGKLGAFLRGRSGNFGILMAFLSLPLLGGAALAIDFTRMVHAKEVVQSALDAAMLGALEDDGDFDQQLALEIYQDNLNILNDQTTTTPTFSKDAAGDWTGRTNVKTELIFRGLFLEEFTKFNVVAKVGLGGDNSSSYGCIYTLYNSYQSFVQNSNARIDAPDCTIFVGTEVSDRQMTGFNAGFRLDVAKICVAGTLSYDNRTAKEKESVELETKCKTPGDFIRATAVDLADSSALVDVKNGASVYSNWTSIDANAVPRASEYSWMRSYTDGDDKTVDPIEEIVKADGKVVVFGPGRYQSINFNSGNYSIVLKPGVYVIDGTWNINGNDLIGLGVTLFFTRDGKLQPNSGMGMMLSAPTSGAFKGMLFWEDPRVSSSQNWTIDDNKKYSFLKGVVYLPNRSVTFNSNASATYSAIFMVDKLTLNSNARMTFDVLDPDYTPSNSKFTMPSSSGGGHKRLLL